MFYFLFVFLWKYVMEINWLWTLFVWWFWTRALTYVVVMTVPYCYSSCICSLKVSHCRQKHQNSIFRTVYTLKINGSIGIFTAVTIWTFWWCFFVPFGAWQPLKLKVPKRGSSTNAITFQWTVLKITIFFLVWRAF